MQARLRRVEFPVAGGYQTSLLMAGESVAAASFAESAENNDRNTALSAVKN
jgi:hypothetical protein